MAKFKIEPADRITRLPPYLFGKLNALKLKKRQAGVDIIDLGMGNPTDPTPDFIVEKLCQAVRDKRNQRYSVSSGVFNLRREIAKKYEKKWGVTLDPEKEIMVRVHSGCLTGDVFGSLRCDCGEQLKKAMAKVQQEGQGVILYLQQEGRGIGLANKLKAYALQDQGLDTVEANEELGFDADLRDYGVGAQILVALGIRKMRIMTNNPKKIIGLEGYDLEVTGRVSIEIEPREENRRYLECKSEKMGHLLKCLET